MTGRTRVILLHVVVITAALVCVLPFLWLALAAMSRSDRIFDFTMDANRFTFDNFRSLQSSGIWNWLLNSMFLASVSTVLVVVVSALAAYGLAQFRFPGRRPLMALMMLTLMIPGQVVLPGGYRVIWQIGWIDSFLALIVPGAANVLGVLLFRQAMLAVPDDLLYAARIDGCSELRAWWDVMLPSIRPMIGAFTLLSFIGNWNSFLWPQIVLQSEQKFTVPIGLANLLSQPGTGGYGPLMAGTLISLVPVTLLFFALQRDFISGLTSAAVKG